MAKLTFVSSTTTLFAATDTAAVAVLHQGTFQQINEGAAASKGKRVSAFRPFDQFRQKTFCLTFIITIDILIQGQDNTREDKPHNNQPKRPQTITATNANLTSLQTYHKLGFFDLANGASAVPTRQQKQQQWARI